MNYLIIGASAAGISAAKKLRKLDTEAEITVISKDKQVYSRCMLHHLISGERNNEDLRFIPENFFEINNINWIQGGEVVAVDETEKSVLLSDNSKYSYDRLLVATGSHPILPPIKNLKQGNPVVGLRNLDDAQRIKEESENIDQAVVIGAGLVGLDAAVGLHETGVEVSVVEMDDRILPRQLDQKAATRYSDRLKEEGIEIITNAQASEVITKEGQVAGLKLGNGQIIDSQLIVVATGVKPNIELIENTNLKVEQGIVVDEYQQTSVADIYAAGDVCQSHEMFSDELSLTPIWPLAVKQGETAAYNMAGITKKITDNFAYQNSMRFHGLSTITYGLVEVDSAEYEVEIRQDKNSYQKLILQDNKLQGAIFQGDVDGSGVYGKLIKEQIDLSDRLDELFNLSYADFFKERENGSFSYTNS
ncbi:FAD-dependent oxidoreductase [Halanaerocella petrolearia]